MDENIERRTELSNGFREIFSKEDIPLFPQMEGSVFWRYNILLPKKRDYIFRELLSEGFPISSWYPSVVPFFEDNCNFKTPIADKQGREILNLWVNDEVNGMDVQKLASLIIRLYRGDLV